MNTSRHAARDLTDAEFEELDELLAATPEPLSPLDSMMLDGYLAAVLVQPMRLEPQEFLPFIFDFDGAELPELDTPEHNAWLERTTALIARRYAALQRDMERDGWFNPLILEIEEAPAEGEAPQEAPARPEGLSDEAWAEVQAQGEAMKSLPPHSQAVMPWVAGFQHGCEVFEEGLLDSDNEAVHLALVKLWRHLPAQSDEARELLATMDREHPLATLDDVIEDLVVTIANLNDLTRDERYRVETVVRDTPKVGRNDPCPCGSGKKYKACHGQG